MNRPPAEESPSFLAERQTVILETLRYRLARQDEVLNVLVAVLEEIMGEKLELPPKDLNKEQKSIVAVEKQKVLARLAKNPVKREKS